MPANSGAVAGACPRLSICLFGPLEVRLDGAPVGGFEYNKVRALLAYLAAEAGPHGSHTRPELCALLWPEATERSARQNLSQALTRLRQALRAADEAPGQPLLLATNETIQLNLAIAVEVDVARFGALVEASAAHAAEHRGWQVCSPCAERLRQAAALYRGDFLAQFFLSDSAPFEEWALLVRERQRQRMLSALERLAQHAAWRGAYDQAAEYARRQVELEPLLEVNHRSAMQLLALAGQTSAALAQFEQLRRTLAEELGTKPEAATTALHEQIRAGKLPVPANGTRAAGHAPAPPTRLIGRETELAAGLAMLRDNAARAVTVSGPPGIGKTRLALELAQALRFDFEDGTAFVDLAAVSEAAQVPAAVAQALGVREQSGKALPATLAGTLRNRHLLLVLDNFEHVLEAAGFAAELLAACPALKLLITSRAALGIRAERQLVLPPLALPRAGAAVEEVALSPAVQLFMERAQSVRPGFDLTPEQAGPIATLCTRLDGLPLAIELMAARANALPAGLLLPEAEGIGLDALAGGWRDLPERQRTLRGAFRWSLDLLSGEQQAVFAHLGVFSGGFTAEAVQAVTAHTEHARLREDAVRMKEEGTRAAEVLDALRQASLIRVDHAAAETRWAILETAREFALELLPGHGGVEAARHRHAEYFRGLAEQAEPELIGPDQKLWFDRLDRELPNLRSALAWCQGHAQETGLRLAAALDQFWGVRGHAREGRRWLKDLLAASPSAGLETQARALFAAGRLARLQGSLQEAQSLLGDSRRLFMQTEEASGLAQALVQLGIVVITLADYPAGQALMEEGLEIARAVDDRYAMAGALNALSHVADRQGDRKLSRSLTEQSLALHQARRDPRNTAGLLLNLGLDFYEEGEYAEARQRMEASLATARQIEDQTMIALDLMNLSHVLIKQGLAAEARPLLEEALAIHRALNDDQAGAATLGTLGMMLTMLGELGPARARQSEALRLRAAAGERRGLAVTLERLAQLDWRERRLERAARLLGAAETIREAIGSPVAASAREDHEQVMAAVRAEAGEARWAEAWAAGRALSDAEAVALALEGGGN